MSTPAVVSNTVDIRTLGACVNRKASVLSAANPSVAPSTLMSGRGSMTSINGSIGSMVAVNTLRAQ